MTLNRIWITCLTTVAYPHTNKVLTLCGIYDEDEEEEEEEGGAGEGQWQQWQQQ